MKTILHNQEGSLPKKMVNWPLNLSAAPKLADEYDSLAETGGVKDSDELQRITGFGDIDTCTLCTAARWDKSFCDRCLHYVGTGTSCVRGESRLSYKNLENYPNPENLRARAAYIREVINKFE